MPPITVRSYLEKIFATGQTAKQPISFGDFFLSNDYSYYSYIIQ